MNANDYILTRYQVAPDAPSPIRLPDSRHRGLIALWHKLGYQVGVEVGVDTGRYSKEICLGLPGVRLYGIDPWQVYDGYGEVMDQSAVDQRHQRAARRLRDFSCTLIRKTSLEAVVDFAPNSVDFVFIDGNHEFDYVISDIIAWHRVVRPGGMLAGHDYLPGYRTPAAAGGWLEFGVVPAVNAYTAAHAIHPWFVFAHDRCPSWAWMKP